MDQYNISYEVASLCFMVVSIACLALMRRKRTERYKRFLILMIVVLCGLVFDILGAVTINNSASFPYAVILISNTLYFFFAAYSGYAYLRYAQSFVGEMSGFDRVMSKVNHALVFVYILILVLNLKTGWIFRIDENMDYSFGTMHFLCYIPTFYFIIYGLAYAMIHRKNLELRETLSFSGFVFITLGTLLQALLFPGTLLTFFFGSISILIILLFLETPDYAHLQETLTELDMCRIEAEKAGRIKSEFLRSISREIKTPMNTVLGMDEMILRESNDDYISGYARDIATAGRNLMDTINKMLDYSDIEAGKLEIVKAPYKVETLVREIFKSSQDSAEKKGLNLYCDLGALVPEMLVGDCVRIRQIIMNLVGNGIKYTSKGSVGLYVSSKEIDKKNVMMEIRVSDTGIGIAEEKLSKIFGTFDRSGDVLSRSGEGLGLGLAIVTKLTDMMEGEVKVQSQLGKGSVFIVTIPQKIAEESDLVDMSEDEMSGGSSIVSGPLFTAPDAKVLIVDDNDINRVLEAMLLKETEVQTNQVSGGVEMLEELTRNSYDVVLLDHIMPDMDGVEALKRAKQIERVKNTGTSFIAITANALSGARDEYIRQGFDDFVSKPINGRRLEEAVMKRLDKSLIKENRG